MEFVNCRLLNMIGGTIFVSSSRCGYINEYLPSSRSFKLFIVQYLLYSISIPQQASLSQTGCSDHEIRKSPRSRKSSVDKNFTTAVILVMITLKYNQIPRFLHDGSFYKALDADDEDGEIQVPEQCFIPNENLKSVDDCAKLFRVTAFWGLSDVPSEMVQFCSTMEPTILVGLVHDEEFAKVDFAQDLCTIFVPRSAKQRHNPLVNAISIGRSDVVLILARIAGSDIHAAAVAAEYGRLDYLILLHKHGHPWDETACDKAAVKGHIECLKYLHENGCVWDVRVILHSAENGHFDCLKYVHEQGLGWHGDTTIKLAEKGNLEMLKYAINHGCAYEERTTYVAACEGQLECLRYLLSIDCPINNRAVGATLEKGHFDCLKLLLEDTRFPLEASWPPKAAYNGHFYIVRYLHELGCPWDKQTADAAANGGHFDILCYAIQNGGGYDYETLAFSATHTVSDSALQCVKYLIEQRGFYVNYELLVEAFIYGNYHAVEFLLTKRPFVRIYNEKLCKKWSKIMRRRCENECYDLNLSRCLAVAMENGWNALKEAPEVVEIIGALNGYLPLSCEWLNKPWEKDRTWGLFCFFKNVF